MRKAKRDVRIPPHRDVTVTTAGNTLQILYMSRGNLHPQVRKLAKDTYLHLGTGEIIRSRKAPPESRAQSLASLKKSFQKVALLVQANTADPEKVRWVTLTYAENMQDTKRLYEDFRRFYGRLKTYCRRNGWDVPEYLSVAEPQERGAWHLHVFLVWQHSPAPFLPNGDLSSLWSHGFTKITKLKPQDNVAAYLVAYLSDLDIGGAGREEGGKEQAAKRIVKGARLHLYPPGFNIFRHSNGITRPKRARMAMREAQKLVEGNAPAYSKSSHIRCENGFEVDMKLLEYKALSPGKWGNTEIGTADMLSPA